MRLDRDPFMGDFDKNFNKSMNTMRGVMIGMLFVYVGVLTFLAVVTVLVLRHFGIL